MLRSTYTADIMAYVLHDSRPRPALDDLQYETPTDSMRCLPTSSDLRVQS